MAIRKWSNMTEDEKLEIINPALDNLRNTLLSKDTLDCVISSYCEDERPEIRTGAGSLVHMSYLATDTIEIKINRVKRT